MRLRVLFGDKEICSKTIEGTDEEANAFAEQVYTSLIDMDKLKIDTPDGWAVIPKKVMELSLFIIDK